MSYYNIAVGGPLNEPWEDDEDDWMNDYWDSPPVYQSQSAYNSSYNWGHYSSQNENYYDPSDFSDGMNFDNGYGYGGDISDVSDSDNEAYWGDMALLYSGY